MAFEHLISQSSPPPPPKPFFLFDPAGGVIGQKNPTIVSSVSGLNVLWKGKPLANYTDGVVSLSGVGQSYNFPMVNGFQSNPNVGVPLVSTTRWKMTLKLRPRSYRTAVIFQTSTTSTARTGFTFLLQASGSRWFLASIFGTNNGGGLVESATNAGTYNYLNKDHTFTITREGNKLTVLHDLTGEQVSVTLTAMTGTDVLTTIGTEQASNFTYPYDGHIHYLSITTDF